MSIQQLLTQESLSWSEIDRIVEALYGVCVEHLDPDSVQRLRVEFDRILARFKRDTREIGH
jgi:hypothetical protein